MNTNHSSATPRKKDLITLLVCCAASFIVFLLFSKMLSVSNRGEAPASNLLLGMLLGNRNSIYNSRLIWLIAALLLLCLYISFLESRDKDPFVTGKTLTMGVMNSFVGITVIIIILSESIISWLLSSLIIFTITFLVRELGRRFSAKKERQYIGKTGMLLTDLHNHGTADISGKRLAVCSKEDMKQGDWVEITELSGNYLYVKKL